MRILSIVLAAIFVCVPALAERTLNPPGTATAFTRDAASTNIPTAFSGAGSALKSGLTGKSRITCCTSAATKIWLRWADSACSTAGDQGFVPAAPSGGTACNTYENVLMNGAVCARSSSGSAIAVGVTDCTVW